MKKIYVKNLDWKTEDINYLIKEINPNELWNKKHKKVSTILNYTEHFLFLVSVNTGCVLISAFASLVGAPIRITSFVVELKICAIAAVIKKYKSIFKKIKRNMIK